MNNSFRRWFVTTIAMLCLSVIGICQAGAPATVGYQGRLYDAANTPINSTLAVVFSLYASATGGTPVWTETQSVTFADGYFSVKLGSVTPFTATSFDGSVRYLGVTVANDPEMLPRTSIASVPYALGTAAFGNNTGSAAASKSLPACILGQVLLTATSRAPGIPAVGQLLPVNRYLPLFSLLGTTYGGDGSTTFGIPDLRNAAPNGMTYTICDQGTFPSAD